MEKSSTQQQIFKKREIALSDQPSPTDEPKAHREAVYPDTHQEVNQEVDLQVCQVEQDSPEAAYRKRNHEVERIITQADFERRVNAEYQ